MKTKAFTILILFLSLSLCFPGCNRKQASEAPVPAPSLQKEEALSIMTNIQYGSNKDRYGMTQKLFLDLYFPPKGKPYKARPLAMMIHGGAYVSGDKSDMKKDCQILADSGFVVASINYRLGWDNGTGDCNGDTASLQQAVYRALQDANAALRFLVANASTYAIDTSWIFTGGSSAGANIALNTSYIDENIARKYFPDLHKLLGAVNTAGNQLTGTFTIRGICNMWGSLPDSLLITPKKATATISFHGTGDSVVPYDIGHFASCNNYPMLYGSLCVHRQLLRYNKPVITNLVIGGGHGPDVYDHPFLMSNTACFWKRIIKGEFIRSRIDTDLLSSCN